MTDDPFQQVNGVSFTKDSRGIIYAREVGRFFKTFQNYHLVGKAVTIEDSNSIKEMITDSKFVWDLNNSETIRGHFTLNPPSYKNIIGFLMGTLIGAMFLGKIFYFIVRI